MLCHLFTVTPWSIVCTLVSACLDPIHSVNCTLTSFLTPLKLLLLRPLVDSWEPHWISFQSLFSLDLSGNLIKFPSVWLPSCCSFLFPNVCIYFFAFPPNLWLTFGSLILSSFLSLRKLSWHPWIPSLPVGHGISLLLSSGTQLNSAPFTCALCVSVNYTAV